MDPFPASYVRRIFYRRRRPYQMYSRGSNRLAKKAYRLAKAVSRRTDWQYQRLVHDDNDTPIERNGPAFNYLTSIAQGDDRYNRTGNSVRVVGLNVKGMLRLVDNPTQANGVVSIYFIIDRAPNGTLPTPEEVFQTFTAFDNTHNVVNVVMNPEQSKRFKCIKRITRPLNEAGQGAATFKFYKKLNLKTTFLGSGTDIANAGNNHLFWIAMTSFPNTNAPASYDAYLSMSSAITFTS